MQQHMSSKMILDRRAVLRHSSGQSVRFEPGVPIGVAPQLVKSAIGMGARMAEGKTPDLSEPESATVNRGPVDPDERIEEITEVIKGMIVRNERDEWDATGTPSVKYITETLGYKVQKTEVIDAFAKARQINVAEVNTDD